MDRRWTDPAAVLDAVARIAGAVRADLLAVLSTEITDLVAHRAALLRTADCARDPIKAVGDAGIVRAFPPDRLQDLAAAAELGAPPRVTTVDVGGSAHRVVVVSAVPAAGRGATLVLVGTDDPPDSTLTLLGHLWSAVAAIAAERALATGPDLLAGNLAASTARARTTADLNRAHRIRLHGILAVLRSTRLPDDRARHAATDLASAAVVTSRSTTRDAHELTHQTAQEALAALAAELAPIAEQTELDVVGPSGPATDLPLDVAATARAVSRGLLLAALERPDVTRLRCAWTVERGNLQVEVRDDGTAPAAPDVDPDLPERVEALGGRLRSESTPGWGTIATAEFPLHAAEPAEPGPIHTLHPREREVLGGMRDGMRNREIAERLGLSEHTVKFHVRNILGKLDVRTRGEAAALAHDLAPALRA